MNTSEVAKLLGVSASTIQRWVKQLNLPMERNERGHYFFTSEDIDLLKDIQSQIQTGTLLQEIAPVKEKKTRKGSVKSVIENSAEFERLYTIINELEVKMNNKADSVASYQLLQHRRELEDMQTQITMLTKQVESLHSQLAEMKKASLPDKPLVLDKGNIKRKKKNIVSSLFGF